MALKGIKVVELLGLAPGPYCGSILADFGATVTVVDKLTPPLLDVMSNGKRSISVNIKSKEGTEILKKLCATSDVLLDTFRPGVLEKLGLGPEQLLKQNSRLIYARLTGYGQNGHYKTKGGHDINYVAMSGILSMLVKNNEPPSPPINLLADFAGGGLVCAFGILLALLERVKSGKGQIIDASMTEGVAYIASWLFKAKNILLCGKPGTNLLDGGSAHYATYKTKDGKFMAVGALEPQFYSNLLKGLELSADIYIQSETDLCKNKFKEIFLTKTQDEWCAIFDNLDACVTPVLDMDVVDKHQCNSSRSSFYRDSKDLIQPEPAPRLSASPGTATGKKRLPVHGQDTEMILRELGYTDLKIQELITNNCVYAPMKSHL